MLADSLCSEVRCAICGGVARSLFGYQVMFERDVELQECTVCDFLFLANPDWLADSFSTSLNSMDIGSLDRSLLVVQVVRGLLVGRSGLSRKILDYGGGDGAAVRRLRDHGFDARYADPFASPCFDVGPTPLDNEKFDYTIMSEVALHLEDPLSVFKELLSKSENVLFTAVIPPRRISRSWWYLMPSTGQHVSFYRISTLRRIAKLGGWNLASDGRYFHLLSNRRISLRIRLKLKFIWLTFLISWLSDLTEFVRRAVGRSRSLAREDASRVLTEALGGGKAAQ